MEFERAYVAFICLLFAVYHMSLSQRVSPHLVNSHFYVSFSHCNDSQIARSTLALICESLRSESDVELRLRWDSSRRNAKKKKKKQQQRHRQRNKWKSV